ncbi:hypothetical protein [Pontixanthobacter luteolus]|uniref:hypothetical protein n=1 Tax=Pontixanthobacter luteolus TaxID=295089 RepID=UPI002302A74D|nr:hypothetical protein [Pontixanthobacter luteolus]
MRFARLLRRYNQVALAIVLTWVVVAAAVISFYTWRDVQEFDDYREWETPTEESLVRGEEVETSEGAITVYKSDVPDDPDAVRDVRYVSMNTGNVVRIADDPTALVYQEKAIGEIGRVALIKTGMRGERPVFDFVFVSFPDLNRSTIARGIDALDTTQPLDDNNFSAIIWEELEMARFIIVDARTGKIETSRSLETKKSRSGPTGAADSAGAAVDDAAGSVPENSF